MRRLFIMLFILSLGATAAAVYWRTFMPEAMTVSRAERPAATRGAPSEARPPAYAPGRGAGVQRTASDRQDWAVTISIASSIISALAALVQTWLAARAMPPMGRVGD
jgi:hypothetical protein